MLGERGDQLLELPHPRTTRNGWGRRLEGEWGCTAGKLCWGTEFTFPPEPHPSWDQNLAWGSSTLERGLYLYGSVEHLLLSEAQALQVGFELLHVLLAHIGCPCCQRNGGGRERNGVLVLLCSWVIPVVQMGSSLAVPIFPLSVSGEKGVFALLVRTGDVHAP